MKDGRHMIRVLLGILGLMAVLLILELIADVSGTPMWLGQAGV